MDEPIISVSGLRGIVGQSLTPQVAARYLAAFLQVAPPGDVVVTRDGRASGPQIAEGVLAAVAACDRTGLIGHVAATPTTGVLVQEHGAACGVQISASHNPAQYNGLKLFGGDGRVIPAALGQQVLERYHQLPANSAELQIDKNAIGRHCREIADPFGEHLQRVMAIVDVERIREKRFRVLLDSNHGAGGVMGKPLLEALGCDVEILGGEPDGQFAHTPEPTAENLTGVCGQVLAAQADIGFCQDPDADRLAIIDAAGNYIGEEFTLAICAEHILRQSPGAIVTNCSTSRMSQDVAEKHGAEFFHSAVGEANVVDVMLKHNAVLGGEGNGGVIDPRVVLVRDSMTGMAIVLDAMAARELSVAALAAELPQYAMHKAKMSFPTERFAEAMEALEVRFADAQFNRMDGLRLDWPGAWLLVRPSNTEPVVRAIAEAPSMEKAKELCDQAAEVLAESN